MLVSVDLFPLGEKIRRRLYVRKGISNCLSKLLMVLPSLEKNCFQDVSHLLIYFFLANHIFEVMIRLCFTVIRPSQEGQDRGNGGDDHIAWVGNPSDTFCRPSIGDAAPYKTAFTDPPPKAATHPTKTHPTNFMPASPAT